MSALPLPIAQVRISTELDAHVNSLAAHEGMSRPDFLRRAIEHEVLRLTQTRPARTVTLDYLKRQIEALASQVESMDSRQVKNDLLVREMGLALGLFDVVQSVDTSKKGS